MVTYKPTGPWLWVKQLQYIEETVVGQMPTASPAFSSAGLVMSWASAPVLKIIEQTLLGLRTVYDFIKTEEDHSFKITHRPINTDMIKYGMNDENTGTKNIGKSLSMLFSYKLNNVENYVTMLGAFTDSIEVKIAMGNAIEVTQGFWLNQVTTENPVLSPTLTTPTFASALSGRPLTHASGGADPCQVNGVVVDVDEFTVNVNWNPFRLIPNGVYTAKYIQPTNERVTGSFKTWKYDTVNNLLALANTQVPITYTVDTVGPKTITLTNAVITPPSVDHNTGTNAPLTETFNFSAKSIAIT
jgi:hypothetical protein